MRARAAGLALVLAVTSSAPRAETARPARGWRTGLGLGLVALGAGGLGLGLGSLLAANDAQARLNAYTLAPALDPADGAQTLPVLTQERDTFSALAVLGFAAGGLLLGGAAALVVLDGRPAAVALVPTHNGAFVSFAVRL